MIKLYFLYCFRSDTLSSGFASDAAEDETCLNVVVRWVISHVWLLFFSLIITSPSLNSILLNNVHVRGLSLYIIAPPLLLKWEDFINSFYHIWLDDYFTSTTSQGWKHFAYDRLHDPHKQQLIRSHVFEISAKIFSVGQSARPLYCSVITIDMCNMREERDHWRVHTLPSPIRWRRIAIDVSATAGRTLLSKHFIIC